MEDTYEKNIKMQVHSQPKGLFSRRAESIGKEYTRLGKFTIGREQLCSLLIFVIPFPSPCPLLVENKMLTWA